MHLKNPKNIIFWYLNINSVQNKFKNMPILISEIVDILIVAETFLAAQLLIPGFHHPFQHV